MKRTANKVFDDAVNIVKSHIDDLQHDKEFLIEELRGYLNKPDRKYRSWAVDKESLLDIANDVATDKRTRKDIYSGIKKVETLTYMLTDYYSILQEIEQV